MEMNRIDRLFEQKKSKVLSVYITAGYPQLEDTAELLRLLQHYGADMVEIGIPFSDPLADGAVIQQSSQHALNNGMTLPLLFDQLKEIRREIDIPLLLMGYLNPVLQMGMHDFLAKCRETGIDGVIIPDLPPDEYAIHYEELFGQYGIHNTLLITPQTDKERIEKIAGLTRGFLYMVADASTTGAKSGIGSHQLDYFRRIRSQGLAIPTLIGFGISNRESFQTACDYAAGAIIGSAFIKALEGEGSLEEKVKNFIKHII
jgi:tryptophan synthase alpha chain